jgi:hypothetical protein
MVLMDSPPPTEDINAFMDVNRRLRAAGLHAPEIIHANSEHGFLLLEDLGDDLYRGLLNRQSIDFHFKDLFEIMQTMVLNVSARKLPLYDAKLLRSEMDLFSDWYLSHHRKSVNRFEYETVWPVFRNQVITSVLEQPKCFVHRDFHSCNLLRTKSETVGIIDFQDAVKGPVSYDFVSLIWDRYISWPREQIEHWTESFLGMLNLDMHSSQWQRDCDLMSLQRNFKIVGIFARLYYRDGKEGYIEMIPRFYQYLTSTLRLYPEFEDMLNILEQPECEP